MIASFAHQSDDESTPIAIERVIALLETQLADPDGLLDELLTDAAARNQLTFDHVGMMLPRANGQQAADALTRLGFRVTEQFESTVVAGMVRAACGQSDLRVSVTTARCASDHKLQLEVFCPENGRADHQTCLEGLAPEIAHVAYRPMGDGDFEDLCAAVERDGFAPLMHGKNGNQRGIRGGSGVCLRYFVKPSCALGQVKLEVVTPMIRSAPSPAQPVGD
jgi:hypothetical protein